MNRLYTDDGKRINDIESAIELLCFDGQSCTVTEVLRLCRINQNDVSAHVVLEVARRLEYRVEQSGRGHRIFDDFADFNAWSQEDFDNYVSRGNE